MIFKKLNLEFFSFTEENIDDIKNLLNKGMKKKRDRMKAIEQNINESQFFGDGNESILDPDTYAMAKPSTDYSNQTEKRDRFKSIDDAVSDETGQQAFSTKSTKVKVNKRRSKRRE
jgi:hypothetical protein